MFTFTAEIIYIEHSQDETGALKTPPHYLIKWGNSGYTTTKTGQPLQFRDETDAIDHIKKWVESQNVKSSLVGVVVTTASVGNLYFGPGSLQEAQGEI